MRAPGSLDRTYSLAEIIGLAFRIYAADWRGFVILGSLLIPLSVAATLAQELADNLVAFGATLAALLFLTLAVSAIVEAAVVSHMLDITAGVAATEGQALERAVRRRGDLLKAVYRSTAIIILLLPTIVLPVNRAVRWIYIPQAVMVDNQTSASALAFSSDLVAGSWWRTLGRVAVLGIIVAILTSSVTGLAMSAPLLLYALVSAIADAFVNPYFSIALTLSYFDLKARKAEDSV
jgi:hypothetical protein